ncbi:hypothetical protein [Bacteroides thetaiotaomicron]|uniref:hypothetical protein n=1 Tax=Bacteroides thetaiotaomicron TaxID=818 RepID=UPI001F479DAB|nr:hypothetical protein [Bacteroides thetaiotaomicron]MCE8951550.1 hypothetical protein [Bacteroides thetaiotaomicron]MCE8969030.1 hypothetical protein [Bacteroides thetaiotaomicron]
MMEHTILTNTLKLLEPTLTECFGYKRRMLEEELRNSFYKYYRNDAELPNRDKYMVDIPLSNEPAVDTTTFSYQRYIPRNKTTTIEMLNESDYIMDTEQDIELPIDNGFDKKLRKLVFKDYKQDDTIYNVLAIASVMYRKYQNDELYTDAIQWSENLPYYLTDVRPDMLKLYTFIQKAVIQKKPPINPVKLMCGNEDIVLDNSCYWLSGLFLEYLQIYLGVDSLEEAEQELKEKYTAKKGRKADNPTFNLIMVGTSRLLKQYSTLKTKSEQLRLILDYLELLEFFAEDDSKNDENYINATISYLEKQGFIPKWKPKYLEDYNTSPNNPSCNNLW